MGIKPGGATVFILPPQGYSIDILCVKHPKFAPRLGSFMVLTGRSHARARARARLHRTSCTGGIYLLYHRVCGGWASVAVFAGLVNESSVSALRPRVWFKDIRRRGWTLKFDALQARQGCRDAGMQEC